MKDRTFLFLVGRMVFSHTNQRQFIGKEFEKWKKIVKDAIQPATLEEVSEITKNLSSKKSSVIKNLPSRTGLRKWQKKKIIPNEQFQFRKVQETTQQILRISEAITDGLNKVQRTRIIILDIAKALDKVWHKGWII